METDREPEEVELNQDFPTEKSAEANTKFEKVKKIKEEEYKKSILMNYWQTKIGDRIQSNQIHQHTWWTRLMKAPPEGVGKVEDIKTL